MRFLSCVMEVYSWVFLWEQDSYPCGFAGSLHADACQRDMALQKMKDFWAMCTWSEQNSRACPGFFRLRSKLYYLDYSWTQIIFRLLAHFDFQCVPESSAVFDLIHRSKTRCGDSAMVENAHKLARRIECKGQDHKQIASQNIFHQIRRAGHNPLEDRGRWLVEMKQLSQFITCPAPNRHPPCPSSNGSLDFQEHQSFHDLGSTDKCKLHEFA